MININNTQNLEIYTTFINEFGELLRNIDTDSTTNIFGVNVNHTLSSAVTISDDPFATNTIITPLLIVMNEAVCNDLNLTKRECFAMIAHEIGHILDTTPRVGNETQREINADIFTVRLGLSQELINGLTKIIDSCNYDAQVEGIQERIGVLRNE